MVFCAIHTWVLFLGAVCIAVGFTTKNLRSPGGSEQDGCCLATGCTPTVLGSHSCHCCIDMKSKMQLCHGVGPSCYSPWFARMMRIFMESCVDILSSLTKRCEHCDLFVAFINIAAIVLSPFAPWNQMLMIVRSLGESKGWDPWRVLNIQYQYLHIFS